jgi:hypothetical protein
LAETALPIATVNNIFPVGVGTHLVKAIYSGDVNYGGSTSADVSLTVAPPGLTLSGTPVSVVAGATRFIEFVKQWEMDTFCVDEPF